MQSAVELLYNCTRRGNQNCAFYREMKYESFFITTIIGLIKKLQREMRNVLCKCCAPFADNSNFKTLNHVIFTY